MTTKLQETAIPSTASLYSRGNWVLYGVRAVTNAAIQLFNRKRPTADSDFLPNDMDDEQMALYILRVIVHRFLMFVYDLIILKMVSFARFDLIC